jgi:hypothetical protein
VGNAIEPIADHRPWHNRSCFSEEDEKRGLKSIFSVVFVVQYTATDTQDHWAMSP